MIFHAATRHKVNAVTPLLLSTTCASRFQDGYALILKTGAIDFAGSGVVHMTGEPQEAGAHW